MSPAPSRPLSVLAALVVALLPLHSALAGKLTINDEANLNIALLLQPQAQVIKDATPLGGVGTDFFLRRVRLLVYGSVTKRLSFFMETDQPNFGKDGNFNAQFYVQDAFVSYEFLDKVWVDVGLIIAPLSRHNLQGAIALNTVDFHSNLVRFTAGMGKVWRDVGVQLRGFVGPVGFRAAILNGQEGVRLENGTTVNPDDLPRGVAMVRWNFLTREEDLFFQGIYFAEKTHLSIGAGADYQPNAVASATGKHDSAAFSADVFLDLPFSASQELVFQSTVFHYRQGMDNPQSGTGLLSELGYRFGKVEPVVSAEYFNSRVHAQDAVALRPGVNLWFMKHTFNLKTELALTRVGELSEAETGITGTAQVQFFY
ncbi:OprO/OprP family phosphate-selective porin [Myxococcus sp. K15C18031901]|uniref:porin n=1 Tax=Myxococcus dinghuensis TaxID=2906761 RepID=UPI0020A71007|nr:porin [Myxococcus dinghuensis]MCP3101135.1 OprO/OprP family phosphate-selective porin [Myxococcus dinghuensis]